MTGRHRPAGDYDYERHGASYALRRRTDPRIAALVHAALGDARTIVNVGAGAGSYEPTDRWVLPVEPSAQMRTQRRPPAAPAIDATAESLPLDDDAVDAAMAMVTIHQWTDARRGLQELRRVARGPVVILTFDPDSLACWWLADYVPALFEAEAARYPSIAEITRILGGNAEVQTVPVPNDCLDGFTEAFFARPEMFLDADVRNSQSAWQFADAAAIDQGLARLADDLGSGDWDRRYPGMRRRTELRGAIRLITALR